MKSLKYPTKLNDVGLFIKKSARVLKNNLIAVILSGSAVTDDYVLGWSDIDLTFIVKDVYAAVCSCKIINKNSLSFLSKKDYMKECSNKTFYAYMLNKGAIVYRTDTKFKLRHPIIPDIKYRYMLLNFLFCAIKLRVNQSSLKLKVRQLYHALRHLIRYYSLYYYKEFPLTVDEVIEYIRKMDVLFPGYCIENLITKLLQYRTKKITKLEYSHLETETIYLLNKLCFGN